MPTSSVSIRSRLLLLVLSVLLPALAAALWTIVQTWNEERDALRRHLSDSSRALSMVVDEELAHRLVIARVLSLSRMLDSAPHISPEELQLFELQARRAMQGLDGWIELDARDQQLLNTRVASSVAVPSPSPATDAAPSRALVQLLDQPVIGPLEPSPRGGILRAAITQPVQRDGRTLLNLSVTILPQELQAIMDHQRLPADWIAAVIDSHGTVVARYPGGPYAGRKSSAVFQEMVRQHKEASFETVSFEGQSVVSYFSTSSHGWTFVTAVPQDAFTGMRNRALLPVVAGMLLLLVMAVGGALYVSRRIAEPVYSLKAAAMALQAGRAVPAQRTGITECDDVAEALAHAGQSVHQAHVHLQQQVDAAISHTRDAERRISQSQRAEALGRLTGGVAHDFNNLLGVIGNSAHLIQRQSPDTSRVPVDAILRSVEVGSRLTQHLLRFAGRQPVKPQTVHLASTLADLRELLGTVLGKRVQLEIAVAPDTRHIKVDPSELELALINMALNARDAITNTGHVWLRCRNAEEDECSDLPPGAYVLISFGDDGQGLDESLANRAFEPFFTTKAVGQGTGLGLSQVHGFCVQAGGMARLASTLGFGTTVMLLLPVSLPGDGLQASGSTGAVVDSTRIAPDMAGTRVLLVEDNEELAQVTATLLTAFGFEVQRATNAEQGLALFGDGSGVDVVLSDVVMPGGMDGVALAQVLRQRRPGVPLVLISGFSSALTGSHGFTVLRKPCAPADLVQALQQAVQEGRA